MDSSTGAIMKKSRKIVKQSLNGKNLDEKCQFMNAIEEKRRYQETNVALGYSDNLLDIFEYIRVVNFQIDEFMLNKFWQMVTENCSVDIHGTILEWLG